MVHEINTVIESC